MGYYTQYVFTLEEGPEEQYRSMTREIDGILSCDDLWQDFWHNGKRFSERVRFADYKDIKDKLN